MRTPIQNINNIAFNIAQSQMSQADDHKSNTQAKNCSKCKVMYGNVQSQNMCSVCYNEKNQQISKQPMTPIKRIEANINDSELLKAPKKACKQQEEDSASNEESQQEEDACGEEDAEQQLDQVKEEEEQVQQGLQNSIQFGEPETNQIHLKEQTNQDANNSFKANYQPFTFTYKKPILIIRKGVQIKIEQLEEPTFKRNFTQFLDSRQDYEDIQGKCKFCKKKTGLLGINCRHCDYQYCNGHRLPQNHKCQVDFIGQYKEKRRQQLLEGMPKHKGKIRQI